MAKRDYAKLAMGGFATVFFFNILAAGVGYVIRLFLARSLTSSEYGLFFAVTTFVALAGFFGGLGLGQTFVKFIPTFKVKGRDDLVRQHVIFVTIFTFATGLILLILIFLLRGWLARVFFHDERAVLVLIIVLCTSIITVFSGTARNVHQALNKYTIFASQYLVENVSILFSLFFVFTFYGSSALMTAMSYLFAYILVTILFFPSVNRLTRTTTPLKGRLPYKKIFGFGFFVMAGSLGSIVILYTDTLILTAFRSLSEVGVYNVVVPTVMLLNFFGTSIAQVFAPLVSELWARREKRKIGEFVEFIFTHIVVILIPAVIIFSVFPERILLLFFGPEYISGASALAILSFAVFFISIYTITASILINIGKPEKSTKALLIGALLNIILNFLFIPLFGIIGAAVSSLFSYFISMVMAFIALRTHVKIRFSKRRSAKILVGSLFFFLLLWFGRLITNGSLVRIVLVVGVSGILYLLFLWLVKALDAQQVYNLTMRLLPKVKK